MLKFRSTIKNPVIFSTILMAVTLFMGVPAVGAESQMVADYLIQKGVEFYEQGDYIGAIHEFSKAVMLEPDNEEAREYLRKLGIPEGAYGDDGKDLTKIARLSRSLNFYKKTVRSLRDTNGKLLTENERKSRINELLKLEKIDLETDVAEAKAKNQVLNEMVDKVREDARAQADRDAGIIKGMHETMVDKDKKLASANDDVAALKRRVDDKVAMILEQNKQFHELEDKLRDKERNFRKSKTEYEGETLTLEKEFNRYKHRSKKTLDKQNRKISDLSDVLAKKRNELSELHDRVLIAERKLKDSDSGFGSKDARIARLQNNIEGLEKEVGLLKKRIRKRERRFANTTSAIDESKIVERSLEDIKFLKRQDSMIAQLKAKLVEARNDMKTAKGPDTREIDQRIKELQEEIAIMNVKLQERDAMLAQKDNEFGVMEERLNDTQQRLEIVDGVMQKKDEQIKELEAQITDILSQFEEETLNLK